MKKFVYTTAILLLSVGAAYAGEHKGGNNGGTNLSCFYDSKPGGGRWHYYFCGKSTERCDKKKYKGPGSTENKPNNDSRVILQDLETFTFLTSPTDTYCCCGGTTEKSGTFVKAVHARDCYTDDAPVERTIDLGSGQTCKKLIYKTVCGTTVKVGCEKPEEECGTGYKWRNNACAPICTGDKVYESKDINTCVTCETTNYQGISGDANTTEQICYKCNKDSHFFDKTNKTCIKKSDFKKQYSRPEMKECWRCSSNMQECLNAIQAGKKIDAIQSNTCTFK